MLLLTATLSFLDTMFLLTPENFPLECAINQQQRQQQLWRRSSEKGHSFFHLLEEKKRGEGKQNSGQQRTGQSSEPGRAARTAGGLLLRAASVRGEPGAAPNFLLPRGKKCEKCQESVRVCVCARVCVRARLQSGDSGN